jgi:hypothetical protein
MREGSGGQNCSWEDGFRLLFTRHRPLARKASVVGDAWPVSGSLSAAASLSCLIGRIFRYNRPITYISEEDTQTPSRNLVDFVNIHSQGQAEGLRHAKNRGDKLQGSVNTAEERIEAVTELTKQLHRLRD